MTAVFFFYSECVPPSACVYVYVGCLWFWGDRAQLILFLGERSMNLRWNFWPGFHYHKHVINLTQLFFCHPWSLVLQGFSQALLHFLEINSNPGQAPRSDSQVRLPYQTPISTPVLLFPWYVARLVRTDKHCWLSNILVMTEFHHTLKTFLQQWKNIQSPQNLCDIILHLYY